MDGGSSRQGDSARRLRIAFGVLAAAWLVYFLLVVTGWTGDVYLADVAVPEFLYAGLLLGAGLLCLGRARGEPDERRVWAAFGAGLTLWSFGDIWWLAFFANSAEVPYPSISDVFWLASYPPMAYGVWR